MADKAETADNEMLLRSLLQMGQCLQEAGCEALGEDFGRQGYVNCDFYRGLQYNDGFEEDPNPAESDSDSDSDT